MEDAILKAAILDHRRYYGILLPVHHTIDIHILDGWAQPSWTKEYLSNVGGVTSGCRLFQFSATTSGFFYGRRHLGLKNIYSPQIWRSSSWGKDGGRHLGPNEYLCTSGFYNDKYHRCRPPSYHTEAAILGHTCLLAAVVDVVYTGAVYVAKVVGHGVVYLRRPTR